MDPYDDEGEYSCCICGVHVPYRQMYCGTSCFLADESGMVHSDWIDFVECWPIVLAKSKGETGE